MESLIVLEMLISQTSESSSASSCESDTEDLYIMNKIENEIHPVSRYYEDVVPTFSIDEFKSHFRISRGSVEQLLQNIRTGYLKSGPGRSPIHIDNI
ncbi:unnamed protein product [Acanthoscelides obtectus]|uniref:Uncharacterized protein n=1 Tax=Acanthoscelides obtectus TaxID=200917 RepID=A0A9P0PUW4_ACAOB|nr:unnamed protein product [Acanthoscelides obtectus]CAK1657261.1 hypothetical protein AOBTE_LOCUS20254 [Acanthoscelides obtectus]